VGSPSAIAAGLSAEVDGPALPLLDDDDEGFYQALYSSLYSV
jgi:hypothetical protein